jgi:hypothetical protein
MYNCWNEAIEYLIKRCGEKITTTGSHYQGGKNTTKNARTYNSSNVKKGDEVIVILMGQYYYGIQAKKDLYEALIARGVKIN